MFIKFKNRLIDINQVQDIQLTTAHQKAEIHFFFRGDDRSDISFDNAKVAKKAFKAICKKLDIVMEL